MTKDEALSLALEALEETTALCENYKSVEDPDGYRFEEADEVIKQGWEAVDAVRKALEDTSVVEPVAWRYRVNGSHIEFSETNPPSDAYDDGSLTHLYASPPITNPEPVAWIGHNRDGHVELTDTKPTESVRQDFNMRPLYTAPCKREWVGLTFNELLEMFRVDPNMIGYGRAVEAELKKRNT